jgi:hypothetical protein
MLEYKKGIKTYIMLYLLNIVDYFHTIILFINYQLLPKVRLITTSNNQNITMYYHLNNYLKIKINPLYSSTNTELNNYMIRYHHEGSNYSFIINEHIDKLFDSIDKYIEKETSKENNYVYCRKNIKFYSTNLEVNVDQDLLDEFYYFVKSIGKFNLKTILNFAYPNVQIDYVKFININQLNNLQKIEEKIEMISDMDYLNLYTLTNINY